MLPYNIIVTQEIWSIVVFIVLMFNLWMHEWLTNVARGFFDLWRPWYTFGELTLNVVKVRSLAYLAFDGMTSLDLLMMIFFV